MNNEQREIADICVYEKKLANFRSSLFVPNCFSKRAIRNSLRKIFKSDRIRSWKEERRERNIFYKNILISIYRSLIMQITFLTTHPAKMFPFSEQTNNETLTYTFYLQSVHGKCFSQRETRKDSYRWQKQSRNLPGKRKECSPPVGGVLPHITALNFPPIPPSVWYLKYRTLAIIPRL